MAAPPHPVILAAAALCDADEVYAMGGAQAIAALAYGTESVERVDVIVGPGNLYVQEAKRQLSGLVGIDGFAGPSDLCVILSAGADPAWAAADLAAQAEHGPDSLVVAVSDDPALLPPDGIGVHAEDLEAALYFAEALAPEHLQLMGPRAEALAPHVLPGRLPVRRGSTPAPRSATTSRAPTTRCPPRAPRASPPASTSATSVAAWPRCGSRPARLPHSRPPAPRSHAPRASRPTPRRWKPEGRIQRDDTRTKW